MRSVTIEQFAKWAICEELPKSRIPFRHEKPDEMANGSAKAFTYCVPIDRGVSRPGLVNEFGMVAFDLPSDPHPDALAFYEAIVALETDEDIWINLDKLPHEMKFLDVRAHDQVAGPMDVLLPLLDGYMAVARQRQTVFDSRYGTRHRRGWWGLTTHMAMNRSSDLVGDPSVLDYARGNSGFPKWYRTITEDIAGNIITREVDGMNWKSRVPYPGAYHRVLLDPDPTEVFCDRLDWLLWRDILGIAAERIADQLTAHQLINADNDDMPWLPGVRRPRLLPVDGWTMSYDKKKKRRSA